MMACDVSPVAMFSFATVATVAVAVALKLLAQVSTLVIKSVEVSN